MVKRIAGSAVQRQRLSRSKTEYKSKDVQEKQLERFGQRKMRRTLEPVSRRSRKVFAPGKPQQNFKPFDYKAVLFTYSYYEQRFSSYKKFQAFTLLCFQKNINYKWLCGPEKFSGLSRDGSREQLAKLVCFVHFI